MAKKTTPDGQPESQDDQEQAGQPASQAQADDKPLKERVLTQAQIEEYSASVWESRFKSINQEQIKSASRLYPAVALLVEENEKLKAQLAKK